MEKVNVKGSDYLSLALYAFMGLGMEIVLAFLLEPRIYGAEMQDWATWQNIAHWIMTCSIWGIFIYKIIKAAKNKYEFDIFAEKEQITILQWAVVAACMLFQVTSSYISWNGSKVVKEFYANGWLKFIFQYIYYVFETGLFVLIIVMGQKAFEKWFKNEKLPYGAIVVALTWGLGHIFTKSSIEIGLLSALSGFIFGVVYLLVNRDIKKTYVLLFLMFVL